MNQSIPSEIQPPRRIFRPGFLRLENPLSDSFLRFLLCSRYSLLKTAFKNPHKIFADKTCKPVPFEFRKTVIADHFKVGIIIFRMVAAVVEPADIFFCLLINVITVRGKI